MSRDDDTFNASRNSVNNSRTVGNTLNSTGRPIYMATIMTITDIMMSNTISRSRMKPGNGVISATMIARTAIGTPSSPSVESVFPDVKRDDSVAAGFFTSAMDRYAQVSSALNFDTSVVRFM